MYLEAKDLSRYWALDIETDDLDATKIWVCCVQNISTAEQKTFTDAKEFLEWDSDDRIYVTHNGIGFDIPVLNRLWNTDISSSRVVDTLVLSLLYNPARRPLSSYIDWKRQHGIKAKGAHSLDHWGFALGERKIEFEDWSEFTPEMLTYCQQDCNVTSRLYKALTKKMLGLGFSEKSAEIEHQFRFIIIDQQNNGFKFDRLRANFFYLWLREKQYECEKNIHKNFPAELVVDKVYKYRVKQDGEPVASFLRHKESSPKIQFNKDRTSYRTFRYQHFNIGSPKQRVDRLVGLGWKPTSFTPKGSPKIDEDAIVTFAKKKPEVQPIADWLVYNGRANMVRTWLQNLNREDDCIHGGVNSCGTGTRRCAHSAPNSANIPSIHAKYGETSRALWVARPKRVLVGADASGLEGRVFIHYLGSKEAEEFMLNDPHTANAQAISNEVGFEVSRSAAKNLFYARLYGASDKKLGAMLNKGVAVGTRVRAAIDGNIPGFEDLVRQIDREYELNSGRIRCIDGGFVLAPSPHSALNYKFQSCGAIIMKQAAIIATKELKLRGLDALKVSDVHDEWEYDVVPEEAEEVGEILVNSMTQAGEALNMNIKIEGEYMVGRTWADVH